MLTVIKQKRWRSVRGSGRRFNTRSGRVLTRVPLEGGQERQKR